MISRLRGVLVERLSNGALVIDCQGVGYEVIPTSRLAQQLEDGAICTVVIYTDVKEDSIRLFGFADNAEREVFNLLLRVTGIGTKMGRDIVSGISTQELLRAIGQGDVSRLQSLRGVGKKTAERIVLELRDLVAQFSISEGLEVERATGVDGQVGSDAVEALVALGFGRSDAERAVRAATQATPKIIGDSGLLVAEALRFV